MLPFDTYGVVWPKLSLFMDGPRRIPHEWWRPVYSRFFTGESDDSGSYTPDPYDMDYDGPVRYRFDIYSTPWLA